MTWRHDRQTWSRRAGLSSESKLLLGGTATLAALVPLAFAPSPGAGADLTRQLR